MRDLIFLDVAFEQLLNRTFGGNRYHGYAGEMRKTEWKNILKKLFNSLEKHIEANIQDDPDQVQELKKNIKLIKSTLRKNKTINEMTVSSLRVLFDISFQLLGDKIDNRDKSIVNHKSHYKLNQKRTLNYNSDSLQNFWKIYDKAGTAQYLDAGFPDKRRLIDLFRTKFKNNSDKFLEWFKVNYPDLYIQSF